MIPPFCEVISSKALVGLSFQGMPKLRTSKVASHGFNEAVAQRLRVKRIASANCAARARKIGQLVGVGTSAVQRIIARRQCRAGFEPASANQYLTKRAGRPPALC